MGMEKYLAEELERTDDLDAVIWAVARERAIRDTMAETGETHEIVASVLDAAESMSSEAVLSLTDGNPTTLRDALSAYVSDLEDQDGPLSPPGVADDLTTLLNYPWPGEEAVLVTHNTEGSLKLSVGVSPENDEHLVIAVGGHVIATANHDDHGHAGMELAESVAEAVHRAVLARVIGDRDHHVQLSSTDRRSLLAWLERSSGTWRPDDQGKNGSRVTVDAVEGGGILVRTRPFKRVPAPESRA